MITFVLDVLYILALVVTSPMWLYRMIRHGRYRKGLRQRLGAVPIRYGLQPTIWIHGVSVGEIKAAQSLVTQLHSQLPDYRLVISSWTDTGLAEARRLFEPDHVVFAKPMDLGFMVRRALKRIRPGMVVLIEGDVWPNFLSVCRRRRIPAVVVNGRMSQDKGYPRYKKLGPLARSLFSNLTAIGVQDEVYAQRFRDLGVNPGKVRVTGMMKFDREVGDCVEGQRALAAAVGIGEGAMAAGASAPLLVAGGTGDGEEKLVLEAFKRLRAAHRDLRLSIVPRKPERFEEVARLIEASGLSCIRRSQHPDGSTPPAQKADVILGDTMGELRKFYALASCVFVGRSLVPMGGSDMIEPAALGKATVFGPHTFNFPQAVELAAHGCVRIPDAAGLEAQVSAWLDNPSAAAAAGAAAQQFIRSQQGATLRNVEMICGVLGRQPAVAPGAIATEQIKT